MLCFLKILRMLFLQRKELINSVELLFLDAGPVIKLILVRPCFEAIGPIIAV